MSTPKFCTERRAQHTQQFTFCSVVPCQCGLLANKAGKLHIQRTQRALCQQTFRYFTIPKHHKSSSICPALLALCASSRPAINPSNSSNKAKLGLVWNTP
ncbi:Uncharacterised protein [Vibrio cholerae]|nr:Uncharacterised protein [Vibrio cholerae]